ncbi:hypothetical protein ACS0TY_028513 [Phlomoides rotata]
MLSHALFFFLLIVPMIPPTAADAGLTAYNPTDVTLLNCGESSALNDTSNRAWIEDSVPGYRASAFQSRMNTSVFRVPYERARVSNSSFTYTFFPVHTGPKFIRLYFYPCNYSDFNTSQSFFSVTANGVSLLTNFSAFLYSKDSLQPSFMKEFVINIEHQNLELTFFPDQNSSAFVNGIEIVSIPDKLYFKGNDVPIKFLDQLFYLDSGSAMENIYRLNVGGDGVEIRDDSGMFRAWNSDDDFIYQGDPGWTPHASNLQINYSIDTPSYSAPEIVYTSARVMVNYSKSLDWHLPVDSGFTYLLRLHFCEIFLEVTRVNERVFTISVNNQTEEIQADVIFWTGGTQIPTFKDYITRIEQGKLPRKNKSGRSSVIKAVVGSVMGVLTVVAAFSFLVFKWQRRKKNSVPRSATKRSTGSRLPFDLCRYFSFNEIKTATSNFSDNFIIGKGGFGDVYKGLIDNSSTIVAIKRLNPSSKQGAREFFTEIEMLSKLRYVHLVSLIGYCEEYGEMILVYDYMAFGTLRDHLYNSENPPLTWKQRLRICQGAAKGLQYLHAGTNQAIIHRDVKSTNILLNEKWVAKISDFGLSKVGPTGGAQTHVSTAVKGSFGYLDPEYYRWQQLTEKSDVYSFGVVLLEVLCARPALNPSLPREQANLAEWAKSCVKEGTLKQIIDSTLDGQIAQKSVNKFVETAMACLNEKGVDRPTMSDVVRNLEFAIQLQEAAEDRKGSTAGADGDAESFVALSSPSPLLGTFFRSRETAESMTIELSIASCKKLMSEDVFTEIKNPAGR